MLDEVEKGDVWDMLRVRVKERIRISVLKFGGCTEVSRGKVGAMGIRSGFTVKKTKGEIEKERP